MLFTDGPFVDSHDLNIIDSEFTAVAAAEGVVVDGSSDSVIYHSILSAGAYFTGRIQNFSGYLVGVGVNSNHLAAVLNILSTAINRPRAMLQQIVVAEPNVTRRTFTRWVRYYCLHDFYRAVYLKRVKEDRYAIKMGLYKDERDQHFKTLMNNGFPVTLVPFSAPGALWDYGAGTWGPSNVVAVAGGTQANPTTYYIRITWVSQSSNSGNTIYQGPTNQNNAESGGSLLQSVNTLTNQLVQVNINSLNPPNGMMQNAIGTAPGVYSPMIATGWNVYVANSSKGPFFLQNSSPIPITTTSFSCQGPPTLSGFPLNQGQPAQYDFTMMNTLWRG